MASRTWCVCRASCQGIDDIRNVVVASRNGVPVRISDVADVATGKPLRTGAAQLGTEQTVLCTAFMRVGREQPHGEPCRQREARGDQQAACRRAFRRRPVINRTDLVNKTIATVQKNLLEGAILVLAVLLLMLGNVRAALLTAMVIPLSMLMLMTSMVETKVSANLMSLGALDFGLDRGRRGHHRRELHSPPGREAASSAAAS